MKYLAKGYFVKIPLSLWEQRQIISLARYSAEEEKETVKRQYLYKIFEVLTGRKGTIWNIHLLNKALQIAGMMKTAGKKDAKKPEDTLAEIIDFLSPRLQMSEEQILRNFNDDNLMRTIHALQVKETHDSLIRMMEQHGASDHKGKAGFFKKQSERLKQLENKVRQIADRTEFIEKKINLINVAKTGAYV